VRALALAAPDIKASHQDIAIQWRELAAQFEDNDDRGRLRVCPDTLGRITKFSKHEPN
jgi:hypothetical protein